MLYFLNAWLIHSEPIYYLLASGAQAGKAALLQKNEPDTLFIPLNGF